MFISVIAWDANFREHLHTIDFFAEQSLEKNHYEFIWVDYYSSNQRVKERLARYPNTHLLTLGNSEKSQWHLGKCINAAKEIAKGELLVIPDGDIAVEPDFLEKLLVSHRSSLNLVSYCRRYDEAKMSSCDLSRTSIAYLKEHAKLYNATNYGGCLTLAKKSFETIGGYETHHSFAGAGASGMETYIRLRNAGLPILWQPDIKIYHPWHTSSGRAGHDMGAILTKVKTVYPWIEPYAGLAQSWIMKSRSLAVKTQASEDDCEAILSEMPVLDAEIKKWSR